MAQFHFIEDYERLVAALVAKHPIDKAMSIAVGGNYELVGDIELAVLRRAGLREGMAVVDLGCGSGRLAHALGKAGLRLEYTGLDVVQAFLQYAATKAPRHFRFRRNKDLTVPLPDASADLACAFSLFTHLLHHESFLYMEDLHRVLRPDGTLVFSFLEFASPSNWATFRETADVHRDGTLDHLNIFIERNAIEVWAERIGFRVDAFIGADTGVDGMPPLGQSLAILRKRSE